MRVLERVSKEEIATYAAKSEVKSHDVILEEWSVGNETDACYLRMDSKCTKRRT